MAEINVKHTQGQAAEQPSRQQAQTKQQPGAMETTRRQREGGLARRGEFFPSLFSLGPREFFTMSPFELMRQFTEEMDRAFEDFGLWRGAGGRGRGAGERAMWSPAVEAFEREGNLIVRAELPGLNKDDVKVEITDDSLIIQGERKREHEERGEGLYQSEWSYGHFYRQIPLPEGANTDQARAQFNNGILEVSVPVPEAQRRRRQIPIELERGQQTQAASQTASRSSSQR